MQRTLSLAWKRARAWAGLLAIVAPALLSAASPARPNILWISCEDTSPWLGFCGEKYATTPNLDALAKQSVYYRNAFASAPVCSPSRFGIITGCYATAYGTQRLRSQFPVPDRVEAFPTFLRRAGYYCSNNVKTDYNTSAEPRMVAAAWDACSGKAHWRGRKPSQPFFAVFNLMETHQSKIFEDAAAPVIDPADKHDPARAPIPPFYPDTEKSHWTMARVHDCITAMDKRAGEILGQLKQDGLAEDTIVFFWPDHGQGIPRGKRLLWDTGLKIPLLVYFPEKYRHLAPSAPGTTSDRMVCLLDLGPTLLSLLELPIPAYMQGQAFMGKAAAAPRQYVYGARDRVDEALEVSRSVRDNRYLYVRHFMPDLSCNQAEAFSDQLGLRREITQLARDGKLNADQLTYAGPAKPPEALYDIQNDPWQLHNLAEQPELRPVLARLQQALRGWQTETRDLGLLHEWQAEQMCAGGKSVFEAAQSDTAYPFARVLDTAERVGHKDQLPEFVRRLADADPTVRYWAMLGLRANAGGLESAHDAIRKALDDAALSVQIEAAGILVREWNDLDGLAKLTALLRSNDDTVRLYAARTLQLLGEKARPAIPVMQEALAKKPTMFLQFSLKAALEALGVPTKPGKR